MGRKYQGAFLQAKCDQCHAQQLNVDHAPLLAKGKKLFVDVGSGAAIPSRATRAGQTRADADHISAKTPRLAAHVISYPKGWRPATRMPELLAGRVSAARFRIRRG